MNLVFWSVVSLKLNVAIVAVGHQMGDRGMWKNEGSDRADRTGSPVALSRWKHAATVAQVVSCSQQVEQLTLSLLHIAGSITNFSHQAAISRQLCLLQQRVQDNFGFFPWFARAFGCEKLACGVWDLAGWGRAPQSPQNCDVAQSMGQMS